MKLLEAYRERSWVQCTSWIGCDFLEHESVKGPKGAKTD